METACFREKERLRPSQPHQFLAAGGFCFKVNNADVVFHGSFAYPHNRGNVLIVKAKTLTGAVVGKGLLIVPNKPATIKKSAGTGGCNSMLYAGHGKALFSQLKDLILQWIEIGELKPNDKLPSERTLSEDYRVSRVTVRQALNDLVQDGAITRHHGKGYFVAPPKKIEYRLDSLFGFLEEFDIKKMKCRTSITQKEFIKASEEVREALGIQNNDKVFLLTRVILVEDEPLAINYTFVPPGIARLLDGMNLENCILYRIFEKNNYKITNADQWISAETPTPDEAGQLGGKYNDPVLAIYRKTYVEGNAVLSYSRTIYRVDLYRYFITLKRYPQG